MSEEDPRAPLLVAGLTDNIFEDREPPKSPLQARCEAVSAMRSSGDNIFEPDLDANRRATSAPQSPKSPKSRHRRGSDSNVRKALAQQGMSHFLRQEPKQENTQPEADSQAMQELKSMGFEEDVARSALERNGGNLEHAVLDLIGKSKKTPQLVKVRDVSEESTGERPQSPGLRGGFLLGPSPPSPGGNSTQAGAKKQLPPAKHVQLQQSPGGEVEIDFFADFQEEAERLAQEERDRRERQRHRIEAEEVNKSKKLSQKTQEAAELRKLLTAKETECATLQENLAVEGRISRIAQEMLEKCNKKNSELRAAQMELEDTVSALDAENDEFRDTINQLTKANLEQSQLIGNLWAKRHSPEGSPRSNPRKAKPPALDTSATVQAMLLGGAVDQAISAPGNKSKPAKGNKDPWRCTNCTYALNHDALKICKMCQQPRKAGEVMQADLTEMLMEIQQHENDESTRVNLLGNFMRANVENPLTGCRTGIYSLTQLAQLFLRTGPVEFSSLLKDLGIQKQFNRDQLMKSCKMMLQDEREHN